jgi:hypothetical protein
MILQTFDNGWGPEWPAKQFEKSLVDCMLHELIDNDSRTVIINSTWYSQEYHQTVLAQLRTMQFSHIVLVAMLDPAIPQPDWFSEFDCKIFCIGYYPGEHNIDYWALFTQKYNHDVASMSADQIDTAYMCLNRKMHWHRRRLYRQLTHLNIVDKGLASFGHEHSLPLDCKNDNLAPEAGPDKFGAPNDIASLGLSQNWNRCFLNIVTETAWDINQIKFVSEKIYKPIVGCRPFLVYDLDGARSWLETRGFQTYVDDFNDITDLNLTISDNLANFLKVLCNQPKSYWQKKFVDLQDKIMYNKNQFARYIEQQYNRIEKGI